MLRGRTRFEKRGCNCSHPLDYLTCQRLENELCADLTDTAGCSLRGHAELIAVSISHDPAGEEVGVVEDVEHLKSNIQSHRFGELRIFFQTSIG